MWQNCLNTEEKEKTFKRCEEFYGISYKELNRYELIKGKESLWLVKKEMLSYTGNKDTAGLRLFSGDSFPYKPTFSFFTFFERFITKGFLEFDNKKTQDLIFRREIIIENSLIGYLGIKNKGFFVGVGLAKEGVLLSQVPKKIANQISDS